MRSRDEAEQQQREAVELDRYSIQMAVVLSLVLSLASVAIMSKRHFTDYLWIASAFALPIPLAVYFRRHIAQLGFLSYISALVLMLGAAALFGT